MVYYFILIPAVMGTITCSLLGLYAWYFLRIKKARFPQNFGQEAIGSMTQELINTRLNDVVDMFKIQIPMIGMFLSSAKEESLKESARQELFKLVPEFQQHVMPRVVHALWFRYKYRLFALAFLIGFLLGVVQSFLFFYEARSF
ncbi:MAG: hypothetical protein WCF65_05900 [Parachlamydiaceae bacterium]